MAKRPARGKRKGKAPAKSAAPEKPAPKAKRSSKKKADEAPKDPSDPFGDKAFVAGRSATISGKGGLKDRIAMEEAALKEAERLARELTRGRARSPPPPPPPPKPPRTRGRPTESTVEVAEFILGEMAVGRTVSSICAEDTAELEDGRVIHLVSDRTVRRWAILNDHFRPLYARARELQAHAWFEQTIDIADDGTRDYGPEDPETGFRPVDYDHIQRSKLRVDTRKWATGKLLPREYGDRVKVDLPKDPLDEKNDAELTNHARLLVNKLRALGADLSGFDLSGLKSGGGGDPGAETRTDADAG